MPHLYKAFLQMPPGCLMNSAYGTTASLGAKRKLVYSDIHVKIVVEM
jgi:hypothetical protein